jgi:DNA-binding transcriptional regulator of glucitol operon
VFWTPVWLVRHVLAVALVVAFLALGWWQIGRAAGGNLLSWAYAVEWPVFAGFVVFVWVKEVRRELAASRPSEDGREHTVFDEPPPLRVTRRVPVHDDSDDEQLAAYNRYLAWLNANPDARPADYREV